MLDAQSSDGATLSLYFGFSPKVKAMSLIASHII